MIPKFRVWDKQDKCMRTVYKINWLGSLVTASQGEHNSKNLHFEDVEIMQSTGVFDIEGVEVYEGDVVRFRLLYDLRVDEDGVIVWMFDKACFGICTLLTNKKYELHKITENYHIEVLCNKYECPELLKEV